MRSTFFTVALASGFLFAGCSFTSGEVTISDDAADPADPVVVKVAPSDRPILQNPDFRMTPIPCEQKTPEGVEWYVDELAATFEYKGCWDGPVGQMVVGVLDASGLPPEAELDGRYAYVGADSGSSGLSSLDFGLPAIPVANGDEEVVELRGLSSTGVVVAVPTIAGWADLPELPEIDEGDGTLAIPQWVEIVIIDKAGQVIESS